MKICCFSDGHGILPSIPPESDLVIIGGDITGGKTLHKQNKWINLIYTPWAKSHGKPIIQILGNHDFPSINMKHLENQYTQHEGITIYGTPYALNCGEFSFMTNEESIEKLFTDVRCDILITHGPLYGFGDVCKDWKTGMNINVGSFALRDWVDRYQPSLIIEGHVHEGRGIYQLGKTIIVNAAILDGNYRPYNSVYIIDYNIKQKCVENIEAVHSN